MKNKLTNFLKKIDNHPIIDEILKIYFKTKNNEKILNEKSEISSKTSISYNQDLEQNNQELMKIIKDLKYKYNNLESNFKKFTESAKINLYEGKSKWTKFSKELIFACKEVFLNFL